MLPSSPESAEVPWSGLQKWRDKLTVGADAEYQEPGIQLEPHSNQ